VLLFALFGGAVLCASMLHPRLTEFQALNPDRDDPLAALLGEGRRLFASHAYVKADVYLHRGFYPSMFDDHKDAPSHLESAGAADGDDASCAHDHHEVAIDWIERHGRRHHPSEHSHLGGQGDAAPRRAEREILPWLALSARLDPRRVETYTVGAYWLRRTGTPREAESFLREGLRANPDSPALLFELGRCRSDDHDPERARTLWTAAWTQWHAQQSSLPKQEQDRFTANQILLNLAVLESRQGNNAAALKWLETLLPMAMVPDRIRERIADVRAGRMLNKPER
jgi:tetratricopeptide (TPR) repeat protein